MTFLPAAGRESIVVGWSSRGYMGKSFGHIGDGRENTTQFSSLTGSYLPRSFEEWYEERIRTVHFLFSLVIICNIIIYLYEIRCTVKAICKQSYVCI